MLRAQHSGAVRTIRLALCVEAWTGELATRRGELALRHWVALMRDDTCALRVAIASARHAEETRGTTKVETIACTHAVFK